MNNSVLLLIIGIILIFIWFPAGLLVTIAGIILLILGKAVPIKETVAKWIASFLDEINKNRKT